MMFRADNNILGYLYSLKNCVVSSNLLKEKNQYTCKKEPKQRLYTKSIDIETLTLILSATFSRYCLFGLLACFGEQH